MSPKSFIRTLLAAVIVVGVATAAASPADAHSGFQTYLYLDVTDTTLSGRIEMPVPDMRTTFGYVLDGTDPEIMAELIAGEPEIDAYLDAHFSIGADGTTWTKDFATPRLFYSNAAEESDNYVVVDFTVDVPVTEVPRRLEVTFDPYFDEVKGRDALLLIGNDWKGGVIENEREALMSFTSDTRTHVVDLGSTSWFKTFRSSISLGVNHIRTGPDHIMFILTLLLPSVLVFSTAWKPAKSFRAALWRVSKVVTMFTVAHTITFSLAGLEILPLPPSRLVEAIIAISIAAAALHNLKPIAVNKEWMIAFAFGLFHGMGFASLVEGLAVDRGTQLLALAGRNVGIEIGQTGVVLMVFPALFMLRRTRYYRPFFVVTSLALTAVSICWMIERVFKVDLSVAQVVQPLIDWPRSIAYVAFGTVVAGAVIVWERRAGRLIPIADPESESATGGLQLAAADA